jgi:uncharacterized protein YciI
MFILLLDYIAPPGEVDRVREEHMAWLREHYEDGRFLVSGPKIPRTGGVILACDMPRGEIDAIIASDPFTIAGVAAYDVVEFAARITAAAAQGLRETGPRDA